MNIELENNSAPSIEKFIKEKDIESVIFDLDNTLFATHEYYIDVLTEMGWDMAEYLRSTKPSEIIASDYTRTVLTSFANGGYKPRLIHEQCLEGFELYIKEEKIRDMIMDDKLEDFYKTVPSPYQNTISTLREVCKSGVNVAFHSHAQKEWTEMKVNYIKSELGNLGLYLPYLATDITKEKDKDSWLTAFSMVGGSTKNIMVVGDSANSDLIPPLQVGCRHVVWLNRKGSSIPDILYDYKYKGKCIYMVSDIGELRYISDNNLI